MMYKMSEKAVTCLTQAQTEQVLNYSLFKEAQKYSYRPTYVNSPVLIRG